MGFFTDLMALDKQGRQQLNAIDVKARLTAAQASMDKLNNAMGGSAADPIPATDPRRVEALATVTDARQSGTFVNLNPLIDLNLLVMLPGGIPVPMTTSVVVAQLNLAAVQPGAQLRVNFVLGIPASLHIIWAN